MSDLIIYENVEGIAKIWLNRPERENAISRRLFLAFDAALDKALKDRSVRVIIIEGKGPRFCAGFDVSDPEACLKANEDGVVDWEDRRENTQEEIDLWMKMLNSRKPIICGIHGSVVGGGCAIALCADVLVAAEGTELDNSEFALGMSWTNYMPLDAWKMPMNIAKEKAFTGYPITCEEGIRYGLFNRVVPQEKVDAACMKIARRMLKLAPYTLTIHKEVYNTIYDLQGMKNIIPYTKEIFSIGLNLPGTKENEEMWGVAHDQGPEAMIEAFQKKLKELRAEEEAEL